MQALIGMISAWIDKFSQKEHWNKITSIFAMGSEGTSALKQEDPPRTQKYCHMTWNYAGCDDKFY